jgi:protoporphyrinogen/coproporphyrinogen III oxidase
MAELVEALEARRRVEGVELRLGQTVTGLARSGHQYNLLLASGERLVAAGVVLAVPAFVSASILAEINPEVAANLRAIQYASTATVSLAYEASDIPRPLDGYGYLIPRAEGRPVLACTWSSTKLPGRAPQGHVLLRAFVGRAGQAHVLDVDDAALVQVVRTELRQTLGIEAAPHLQRVYRWPDAMPQYTLGHLDRVNAIESGLSPFSGLQVAGSAYRGVGIPDCIASGEAAADRVLAAINEKQEYEVA